MRRVIAVGGQKGGTGKTTTVINLAAALIERGRQVLMIDTDPQGSLTTLFGILPDTEVDEGKTILPLCMGSETSIRYAIQSTYWDGIDLVAAAPVLFGAEFALPARQTQEPGLLDGFALGEALLHQPMDGRDKDQPFQHFQ